MEKHRNFGGRSPTLSDGCQTTFTSSYPYRSYVKSLCSYTPSLMNLYQFLSEPKAQSTHRMCAIDFYMGMDEPDLRRDLDISRLSEEVREEGAGLPGGEKGFQQTGSNKHKPLLGRILIIEDLSKDIVECLGALLDIDPLFLSLHLHTTERTGSRQQTPDEATLPSRLLTQNYVSVSYHRTVISDTGAPVKGRYLRNTTINRKLVFLRSTNIALAQHCASVIRIKNRKGHWLALILVDPPIANGYVTNDVDRQMVTLQLRGFLGGYDDFMAPHPFSMKAEHNTEKPSYKRGMFDDLQRYWKRERPACFDAENPSIQSLAYYTLRIAAAEWTKYIGVMQRCLKQYEYNHDQLPALSLDKFDRDLRELQSWRRRTMLSQTKIKSVLRFLSPDHCGMEQPKRDLEYLNKDFEYIHDSIDAVGRRLESMLPVVMSFVQITDARRSFHETADISRLTVLALIFVPLTFISSLFSMNTEYSPGSSSFWVYFTVAIPMTGLVVLIARPPIALTKKFLEWMKQRQKRSIAKRRAKSRGESVAEEMSAYRY